MLEAKLVQHMAGICHKSLIQVFLYVKKSYYSLGRTWCMEILRECGLGKNLQRLL